MPTIAPRVRLFAIQTAFTKGLTQFSQGQFKSQNTRRRGRKRAPQSSEDNGRNVMLDAEREIELSRTAQSSIQQSPSSSSSNSSSYRQQREHLENPGSSKRKKQPSPYGNPITTKKISTSAVGSASKVLQLMAERHDQNVLSSQKCLEAINLSNRETMKKMQALTKTVDDQQKMISKGIKMMFAFCMLIFTLCIILLLKSLSVF